ncbi:MAG: hypothetical protein STSR0006_15700 [Lentimicrobium sp.]
MTAIFRNEEPSNAEINLTNKSMLTTDKEKNTHMRGHLKICCYSAPSIIQ